MFFFILGSIFGSFLNVVIDRSLRGESILGRSYCDWCKTRLPTIDLVPILSFAVQKGRCRHCRRKLAWQYPLVEIGTGSLFVFCSYFQIANNGLSFISLIYLLFIVCILMVVTVVDLKFSLIPTTFIFFSSLVALFYNYLTLSSSIFVDHVLAAFAAGLFFGAIVLVTRGRGMGSGDIFLVFLIGMVLGFKSMVLAIFLAFFLGAVVSIGLIFLRRKRFGQTIPFGPFLVLGFFLALFWSKQIIDWYLMLYLR